METTTILTILIIVLFVLVFAIIVFSLSAKVSGTRYRYEEYNRHLGRMEDNLERLSSELGDLRINTILSKNSEVHSKEAQPPCYIIQQPQPVSVAPDPVIIKVITETDKPEITVINKNEKEEPVKEVIDSKVEEVFREELALARKKLIEEAKALEEARILEEAEAKKEERRLSQERAFLEANRLKQKALEEARHTAPTKERAFDFVLPEGDEWEELGVADLDFRRKPETKIAPKFVSVTDNITRSGRSYTEEELKQQIKD